MLNADDHCANTMIDMWDPIAAVEAALQTLNSGSVGSP